MNSSAAQLVMLSQTARYPEGTVCWTAPDIVQDGNDESKFGNAHGVGESNLVSTREGGRTNGRASLLPEPDRVQGTL